VALVLEKKRYNGWTYVSLIFVCGGTVLNGNSEMNFHIIGVIFSILAVFFRSLKNLAQQTVFDHYKVQPVDLLLKLSPVNSALFAIATIVQEGLTPFRRLLSADPGDGLLLAILVSCLISCAFNLTSYSLVKEMSAVGASLVHNLKVPGIALGSFLVFGNEITMMQIFAFFITIGGVVLYKKYSKVIKPDEYGETPPEELGELCKA
jgi:drug/metabolite transporter (DMT)-like permease